MNDHQPSVESVRASLRAQTVAAAMQVIGTHNEPIAEWLADKLMPQLDALRTAGAGVVHLDPDPAVIAEQMRQHSMELVELACNVIGRAAIWGLAAGLKAGQVDR